MVRGTAEQSDDSVDAPLLPARRVPLPSVVAALGIAVSVAVLAGWWADIPALKTGFTGFTAMKANSAAGFAICFAAVWLMSVPGVAPWRLTAGRALAAVALVLGAATIGEYLAGTDLGIDQILAPDNGDLPQSRAPGRMGANTAINFVLVGAALLLARANIRHAALYSQICAGLALVMTFSVLLGYAFGAWALTNIAAFTPMSLHAAVAFTALTTAILTLTSHRGFVVELVSDRFGGVLAKRLLPVIVIGIPLVGWLRLLGERNGYFGLEGGISLYALFNVMMLTAIVALLARWLNRTDTVQRGALSSLRESERRFRSLANNVPGIVYQRVVDRDGNSRLAFISAGMEELCGPGITAERALADPDVLRRQFHPDDRARVAALREAAYRSLAPFEFEARIIRSDGELRWIHNLSHARPQPRGEVIWDGLIIDITARKTAELEQDELQQRLRQAQKMEAVGQLTGGIAHDFNNLLTITLGNVEILEETLGADPAADRKALETIRRAGERGAALTQRLLAFSRQQALRPTQLDINEIVRDLDELLRRTLGESIEIVTKRAADLWPAFADKSQVEEALLNLAVNARDAMPEGGKLTIETTNIWLDETYAAANEEVRPGPYAMLAISDTGSGMPREVIERAFEPFFTTKEVGKGSGLGLSMVFGFSKQSGGHVKIYSEVGHGTTVKLYLPRSIEREDAKGADDPKKIAAAPPGRCILLVEDEEDVRTMTQSMLTRLGYDVVAAADGPAALAELDRMKHVDLLFTDVVLPRGMSGRQLAEEAMRRRPGLKVLYTSGYTQNSIVHHGRLDEGVELIGKPYRAADLARKIAAILDAEPVTVSRP